VNVVVPDVLIAGWLVVLAGRDAVAVERQFHCDCGSLHRSLDRCSKSGRKIEDALVVLDRYDQHVARIIRPPLGIHLDEDVIVSVEHLKRMVGDAVLNVAAEWAHIVRRCM